MSRRIFLSFEHGEPHWHEDVLRFFTRWGDEARATPVYLREDELPAPAPEAVEQAIADKLQSCRGLLAVIGAHPEPNPRMSLEVRKARDLGLKCAITRHPHASFYPEEAFRDITELEWGSATLTHWLAGL
ncbi:MAG TPA: hypothetical protein VND93_30640 [Myxococcales bacterium]|nr:hypothetical protein [Myxococcales bacterium]